MSVVSFRSVSGSALAFGCQRWWVRRGRWVAERDILVAVFASFSSASAFARRWAGECGYGSVLVRASSVGRWFVSVPVSGAVSVAGRC